MDKEIEIKKKKRKLSIYYGLLVTVICIIGVSFAWFRLYLSQTENNTIASRTCFNTTLTEDTSKISLTDAFPITDEDGLKQTPFTFTIKNNCNSYVKVYITIDSTYRESTDTSYLKDNYMKINISPKGTTTSKSVILGNQTLTDLENNKKGYIIVSTGLKANEEKSYDLRIWMDSTVTTEQGLNKNWSGKIVVVSNAAEAPAPAPNGWYEAAEGTLLASLRNNTEISEPITTPGAEVSAHTLDDVPNQTTSVDSTYYTYYITYGTGWKANGTNFDLTGAAVTSDIYANSYSSLVGKYLPYLSLSGAVSGAGSKTAGTMKTTTNLSSVYYVVSATQKSFVYKELSSNKNTIEAELASTEDDYGTSYYFRGAVTNNYVEFANKCWRIVRVGGDGSVKLILHNDNTAKAANPCNSSNNNTSAAFARYSGTTYKSAFNTNYNDNAYVGFKYGTVGSSTYAATHANTNPSTILTNLETWYSNNLKTYESVIDDTVWCNDKTNVTDTSYNSWNYSNVNGLGYAKNVTYYGATQRLMSNSGSAGGTGPSLKCNGELSKINSKVGLITADELAFAGYAAGYPAGLANSTTYLQENATDTYWWSLSPIGFLGGYAFVWGVGGGRGGFGNSYVDGSYGVRASISLKPSTNVTGNGSSESPYKISM